MKVSIIIPVYNVSNYIERSLNSAINQTWQDLEIILINDCTPDNSIEIAREIIKKHQHGTIIRIINHEINKGLSAARNTGIKHSTGEYLFFLDSDDYISSDCIEKLASGLDKNKVDFAIGNYKIDGGNRAVPQLKMKDGIINGNNNIFKYYQEGLWYVMAWNKLVSRDLIIKNNVFFQEGILHEDDLWSFKLATVAQNMLVINDRTYFYVVNPDSISVAPKIKNLESRIEIISLIYDFIISNKKLQTDPIIYKFFENLKSKYFDRIIYYVKDKSFCQIAYSNFREKRYIPRVSFIQYYLNDLYGLIRDFHYFLPEAIGYSYYRMLIRLKYILLILKIKLRKYICKIGNSN